MRAFHPPIRRQRPTRRTRFGRGEPPNGRGEVVQTDAHVAPQVRHAGGSRER